MPHKWQHLSTSPVVRLDSDDPAVLRFGRLPAGQGVERGALLALMPRELVIARDPDPGARAATPYGHDALHIPRCRLEGGRHAEGGARLATGGVELAVALPRRRGTDRARHPCPMTLADEAARQSARARGVGRTTDAQTIPASLRPLPLALPAPPATCLMGAVSHRAHTDLRRESAAGRAHGGNE